MVIQIPSKCEKCGGAITSDHGEPVCLNCGYNPIKKTVEPKPPVKKNDLAPGPPPTNSWERHRWIVSNKHQILEDLKTLGDNGVMQKWRIGIKSLAVLRRANGLPPAKPAEYELPTSNGIALPRMPAFNEAWQPEVKIKWLENWTALATRSR